MPSLSCILLAAHPMLLFQFLIHLSLVRNVARRLMLCMFPYGRLGPSKSLKDMCTWHQVMLLS